MNGSDQVFGGSDVPRNTASERSTRTMSSRSSDPMRAPMVARGTVTILSIMICETC